MQRPAPPRPTVPLQHLAAVLLVLCLATPTLGAEGDYRKSFRNGIGALDRGRFAEAAAAFREALRANGSESSERILIYGTRTVVYLPHLYLAVALKGQKDCAGALDELEASEGQGAVKRFGEYGELKKIRASCGPSPTPVVTASSSPPPRVEIPPAAGAPAITEPKPQPPTATVAPVPQPRIEPAPIPVPTRQPPSPTPVPTAAETAAVAQAAALAGARNELQRSLAEANGLLRGEITPSAQEAHGKLAEEVRKATLAAKSTLPATLTTASARLGASMAQLKKVMAPGAIGLDGRVAEAIRAYIRGDFDKTLLLLQRLDFGDELSRGEGALFRAAAGYALYRLGGDAKPAYRQQAIEDLRQYRRMRKVKSLDARLFAPSFRSLYLETAR